MSIFRTLIAQTGTGPEPQPYIPVEYQEVEYIESTGTQYIDTGISGINSTDELYAKVVLTDSDNAGNFFGWDDESYYYDINLRHANQSNKMQLAWGYFVYVNATTATSINTLYEIETKVNSSNLEFYINNSKQGQLNTTNNSASQKHGLFARFRNNSPRLYAKVKLYAFRYKRNNTLIRDLVPCYRKSDSEIGMYDRVNGTFYTNGGTGTFTKGSDVIR